MRQEIKLLKKVIKKGDEQLYPGHAYMLSAIIDLENKKVYVSDFSKPRTFSIENFIKFLGSKVACFGIDNENCVRGSWLQNSKMPKYDELLLQTREDYYFYHLEIINLYYATMSAIRDYHDTNKLIFAYCDLEDEVVNCQVFSNAQQIQAYFEDILNEE